MSKLLIALLSALAVAGSLFAATNLTEQATNSPAAPPESPEQVEANYKKLMALDDAAQNEIDHWIRDNNDFARQGAGVPAAELNKRILERRAEVRKAYEEFIARHPKHVDARLAFGGFLNDLHDEEEAQAQWEKALALDPKSAPAYNNLANVFTHIGPVSNAFAYYAKASELNPLEPLYYHNLGDTVFAFRHDAVKFYGFTNDQQVYDKALSFYEKALKLDPENFPFASDLAQTYYAIKPIRTDAALRAWTNTLALAHDDAEREGVYLHFARLKMAAGRYAEAWAHVNVVTNDLYKDLKARLVRNLAEQEHKAAAGTNAPAREVKK